jgi:hypothetical protein
MFRSLAILCVLALAACTNSNDLGRAPVPLGDFALGYNVVVAPKMVKGPVSREATEEEWKAALTTAIDERFRRYDDLGSKLYHLGVSVEGYVLAEPGIPIVLSPKSVLIINLTVWDDAAQAKLNSEPHQLTILESASGKSILGSGLTQSKEEQMAALSSNAAKEIQNWMAKQMAEEKWFGGPQGGKTAPVEEVPEITEDIPQVEMAPATPAAKKKKLLKTEDAAKPLLPDETIFEPEVAPHPPAAPSAG